MNIRLSEEQRIALDQASDRALPVNDDLNQRVYYLVSEESFLHLKGLQAEHEQECRDQLKNLIEEGISSPGIPAEEAFARLRSVAQGLSNNVS